VVAVASEASMDPVGAGAAGGAAAAANAPGTVAWRPVEKPPCRLRAIGYVALDVTDLGRSLDFYTRVANLVPTEAGRDRVLLRCQSEHHAVALRQAPEPALRYVAFETRDDGETAVLRRHLDARGVPLRPAEELPGCLGDAFQFQDPEGNWFQVYRAQERRAPIISEAAFPLLRLGHATHRSRDVLAMARFQREVVGLRISDLVARGGLFLRCGSDHHALAYFGLGYSLFHHMAFDVGSWEGTKRTCDWLARQQWAVEDGPVRHPYGNNIAVYCGDPDGFHVEFYSEMEQIADDEDHFRADYQPVRNLWTRGGAPEGYDRQAPRDEHGKPRQPAAPSGA
jgi:catechol-2,3-dioxygenase